MADEQPNPQTPQAPSPASQTSSTTSTGNPQTSSDAPAASETFTGPDTTSVPDAGSPSSQASQDRPAPGLPGSTSPSARGPAPSSTDVPGSTTQAVRPNVLVPPVHVDNRTRRSDEDGLEGHFVDVVSGEHEGRRGVFTDIATYDPTSGYPETILVRSRDAQNEPLVVDYADVRPTEDYRGGR